MSLSKEVKEPFKDLFTLGEFDAIINLREDKLLHSVSYRKDAEEEVKNVFRDMNNHGRDMYASFIQNVGRNIYPVIVASDHEPGFSGVGSTFTLFLADGESVFTCKRVVPRLHESRLLTPSCRGVRVRAT